MDPGAACLGPDSGAHRAPLILVLAAPSCRPTLRIMQLKVYETGSGPRTAILIHGFSDDHKTWWRVAPALVERGFRVLAPDLRGHGLSPHADDYSLTSFAADLRDSLPSGADVILGHSLGALALSVAASDLAPKKLIYVDPPWFAELGPDMRLPVDPRAVTREQIAALAPRWIPADIAVDLASSRNLDPKVLEWVPNRLALDLAVFSPVSAEIPTSVIAPLEEDSFLGADHAAQLQALGIEVHRVPDAGHVIHRDNFDGFMSAIDSCVLSAAASA